METAATRLYKAILKGDVDSFLNLLSEDPLILQQCIIETSGRFMLSPLHVAVDMGNSEIVKCLLKANTSMCLAVDQDGRTPIHVAAAKGHVHLLEVLYNTNRYAPRRKTNNGESILHLCVQHNQLDALKTLLELINDDGDQLLNSKDNNGDTILHLAVTTKQPEVVDCILEHPTIDKNATNRFEMTAVDIYRKQSRNGKEDKRIEKSLIRAKVKPAKDAMDRQAESKWLEDQRSALMVVASLIATMAFQAGINPPGGVWQETKKDQDVLGNYDNGTILQAGMAVWSYYAGQNYSIVLVSNTIGLISSLSVILILISGLPCKRYFLYILRITLWISVTATAITYLNSVDYVTANSVAVWAVAELSLEVWLGFMVIIFLGNVMRLIYKVIGWKRRESIKKYCKKWIPCTRNNTNDGTTRHCIDP